MDEKRRRFLRYAAASVIGAGLAAVGYPVVEGLFGGKGRTGTTTTTSSGSYNPGNVTADYADFLTWLHSVVGPFAGTTLNVALEDEPTPLATQSQDADFARATSMNDLYAIKPYSLHLSDLSLMVNTKSSTYDVFDVDHQDVAAFKDHIFSPTDLAQMYPDLTYAPIVQDDFQPLAWSVLANYPPSNIVSGGSPTTLFIPYDMDLMVQYYRGDVYSAKGLSPATTWDQYFQNLGATNGGTTRFATACQAAPGIPIVYEYLNHLASFGGELWTYDGTQLVSQLGSSEALSALQNYLKSVPYADAASGSYSWDDVDRDLYLGIAGTAIQLDSLAYFMEDPTRSQVIGKMKYAPNPAGPKGSFATFAGSGLGVSKYSKNPQAAWLWLQWAVSKGRQEEAVLGRYHAYPSRKSVLGSPDVSPSLGGQGYQALAVSNQAWESGSVTSLIPFPKWFSALDQISFYLNEAFSGSDPQTSLNTAVQKLGTLGSLGF